MQKKIMQVWKGKEGGAFGNKQHMAEGGGVRVGEASGDQPIQLGFGDCRHIYGQS